MGLESFPSGIRIAEDKIIKKLLDHIEIFSLIEGKRAIIPPLAVKILELTRKQRIFACEATLLGYMTVNGAEGKNAFLEKMRPNLRI
jgi:hypothetical protein